MIAPAETLDDATLVLGEEYRAWKEHENNKNDAKAMFFNNVVEEILKQIDKGKINLRTKVTEIYLQSADQDLAKLRLKQKFPRFNVKSIRITSGLYGVNKVKYEAILEEDPFYINFYYVNTEDGFKYERRCDDGPILLDDERLKAENPELYDRATFELPWGDIVTIPIENLNDKDQLAIQEYIYQGPPVIKLPAPKKATDEEIQEALERG